MAKTSYPMRISQKTLNQICKQFKAGILSKQMMEVVAAATDAAYNEGVISTGRAQLQYEKEEAAEPLINRLFRAIDGNAIDAKVEMEYLSDKSAAYIDVKRGLQSVGIIFDGTGSEVTDIRVDTDIVQVVNTKRTF